MPTYHIHITGIVQGVGFRPFVCKWALHKGLHGWVCNDVDGVHIEFNAADEKAANDFYRDILALRPANALVQKHTIEPADPKTFKTFEIIASKTKGRTDLLLTPDIAICADCKREIESTTNSRFQYAFTTCLNCGPRYSIIKSLPYDRENTTMSHLTMCRHCNTEYHNIFNRRHFSQTNSCPQCEVPLHLFDKNRKKISDNSTRILQRINDFIIEGQILAIKGIGGYLLICDATNASSVQLLRKRKQRPAKPFAVMYDAIPDIENDVFVTDQERKALLSKEAPIVLCELKETAGSGIPVDDITRGLDKLGVFLPYSPLLKLITSKIKKPLIATSANLSGAPIIYKDADALQWLGNFADHIISFDRDIVAPQDDSVVQFTSSGRRIILRRSRGMAPNFIPRPSCITKAALAMGAELKSAFAITDGNHVYISQYLGDQQTIESHESFQATLTHLQSLLKISPEKIIVDAHPNYHSSLFGKNISMNHSLPIQTVQHHLAHFAAVLAENRLLNSHEKILGIIWDGTGYGSDGNLWGGEFFAFENSAFSRCAHLAYFPQLLGDKMNREPRISALVLLQQAKAEITQMHNAFSQTEFEFYQKMLRRPTHLYCSSAGRLLDGTAGILGIINKNSYEGEAAMKLEAAARSCKQKHFEYYNVFIDGNSVHWQQMIQAIVAEKKLNVEISYIARKVFVTLVKMIELVAEKYGTKNIALSGGVFQNSFLCELIENLLGDNFSLYWHQQLSPNDECIGFGQLVYDAVACEN